MGSSTYWYRVDAVSFKHFVKVEDKFDKLEQKLYEKYKAIFDKDMDRLNREWQEVWDKKRKASSVKDEIPIYKVVTPTFLQPIGMTGSYGVAYATRNFPIVPRQVILQEHPVNMIFTAE